MDNNDNIHTHQRTECRTKRLSCKSLYLISIDRQWAGFLTYYQPNSARIPLVPDGETQKPGTTCTILIIFEYIVELRRTLESTTGRKLLDRTLSVNMPSQAESTLRPLARRRLITKRPFFVAIRALNPCARLRFITLG